MEEQNVEISEDFEVVETPQEEPVQEEAQAPAEPVQETTDQNLAESSEAPQQEPEIDDITALQNQVNDLMGQLQAQPQQQAQAQEVPQPQFQAPQPGEVTTVDFIGEEVNHVDLLEDREKFNGLLNKVATVAFNAALSAAQDRILRQIPQVVQSSARQQIQIEGITKDFYAANQDLAPFRNAVSMAAMQLYNENPNLHLSELLAKAAERTRSALRLRGGNVRRKVTGSPVVQGAQPRAGQGVGSALSDQEQQILELLNF